MLAPSEDNLPRVGEFIAAKYRIEEVLGRGGMGAVFRVTHSVTGKHFAVKWLLPQFNSGQESAQRFIREAQVAGRVDHPNVVEVYDIGEDRGSMYMVMELLQGESLAQHLARVERVSASHACQLLIAVTRGLAAAHKSGVIHRDLKPDNIFLSVSTQGEPRPKILDFGISKMSALASDTNPALTREGVVMGTPHYMAPEQLRSHKVDERCDIYALGVILYQMLSGKLPFVGDNFPDLMLKIVSETPVPLAKLAPDAPPDLLSIVECAMSRSTAERFDSVADFGRALEPFGEGARFDVEQAITVRPPSSILPGPTTPVATESRFPPTDGQPVEALSRMRRWALPLAASAASAALACWMYVSLDSQKTPHAPQEHARLAASASAGMQRTKALNAQHVASGQPGLAQHPEPQLPQLPNDTDTLPVPHVTALNEPAATASTERTQDTPALIGTAERAEAEAPPLTAAAPLVEPAVERPIRTGAAPMPTAPPGAAQAAAQQPTAAQAADGPSDAKPKKQAAKKSPAKPAFESPEIRINDFFK